MKTRAIKAGEIKSEWHVFDSEGQTLGRLANQTAGLLIGKHKPFYTPNIDSGDHVVVVNAEKVRVTGRKLEQKLYHRHSLYPGGLKTETLGSLLKRKPAWVIEHAVRGMLPRTTLGDKMMTKLRVYAGPNHPHQGQVEMNSARKRASTRSSAAVAVAPSSAAEDSEPQAT